jgi:hypothetical protein
VLRDNGQAISQEGPWQLGLRLVFPDNTVDDYDKVAKALNFPAEWPDGLVAHGSHEVDGGMVVNEVWETRGHYDRFAEGRLGTTIAETLGDRARPPAEIVERDLHSFYARG